MVLAVLLRGGAPRLVCRVHAVFAIDVAAFASTGSGRRIVGRGSLGGTDLVEVVLEEGVEHG